MSSLVVAVVGGDDDEIAKTRASLAEQVHPSEITWSARIAEALRASEERSEFVAIVWAGSVVAPGAVDAVVDCLGRFPDADVVFGDESGPLAAGGTPRYKPAWSPERLLAVNDFAGFTIYRVGLVDPTLLGGEGDPSAQLHDLALLASEASDVVVHLPQVLCQSLPLNTVVDAADRLAVVDRHLARRGMPASAVVVDAAAGVLGFAPLPSMDRPTVSVIIPTGGGRRWVRGQELVLISNVLQSLIGRTSYPNLEIVVVLDSKSSAALAESVRQFDPERIRVVKDKRPFNFSAACNMGVEAASGEICVLLNDDTEIIDGGWIDRIVALLAVDEVGVVGAKLLYADGRVQHAGVARRRGMPDHVAHGYPGDDPGDDGWLVSVVNGIATTGACLSTRRADWIAVGGMDAGFPLNFNDVDLCLRFRRMGKRVVIDNQNVLTHLETSSRSSGSESWEVERFLEIWPDEIWPDVWDSPNFIDVGMERIPAPLALVEARRARRGPPAPRAVRRQ